VTGASPQRHDVTQ